MLFSYHLLVLEMHLCLSCLIVQNSEHGVMFFGKVDHVQVWRFVL